MKISKKDVKRVFTSLTISICFINLSCCEISSLAYAQVETTKLSEEERKREILKKYPPNLSEMQEIALGTKEKVSNGNLVEKKVRPDFHFRGADGKEYLVFYNNHIEQLRGVICEQLKDNIKNNYRLASSKYTLMKVAEEGYMPTAFDRTINEFMDDPFYVKYVIGLFKDEDGSASKNSINLALASYRLANAIADYGDVLDNSTTPCIAIVDREFKKVAVDRVKHFAQVEKEFYGVMTSQSPYKSKVEQLNKLLDSYLNKVTPEASDSHTMAFCFPLNRASYYLSNLEKNLKDKDLETLESMYALREKINRLTLEHRFIFEQNKAPILNIKIDRCKIIIEDAQRTMIFLDCEETKKFIARLAKMLDSQASDISRTYSFEGFSGKQLRELAESLNPDSFQDIIDNENQELSRIEAESSKTLADAGISAGRAAIEFLIKSDSLEMKSNIDLSDSVKSCKFSEEEVNEYLETQKQNDSSSDSKSHNSLNQMIYSLNLTPFEKSSLNRAFEKYLEYRVMQSDITIKRSKRDFLSKVKTNQEDFINLFKLYILMVRGGYTTRNDFYGVTIEEDRRYETIDGRGRLMRKYFIEEIQRLDDVL